jgi:NAD(P)-dependent dehydrogenase (short-subunit alcohol dehydrogenase family)
MQAASTSNGRVALVTGAARGIGLGIAAWLMTEGWQVVLADVDRARGSRVVAALGENALFIGMDVASEEQVAKGVAEVIGRFGRLDALVCNAAVADPRNTTLESLSLAHWNRVLAVNLNGPMLLAKTLCALSACSLRQHRQPDLDPRPAIRTRYRSVCGQQGRAAGADSCPGDQPGA